MAKSNDLTAQLVHRYLKAGGYHDCAEELAEVLNLDYVSQDLKGLTLEHICQYHLKASSAESNDLTAQLVHQYLKAGGYQDCAEKLALILDLDDVSQDLKGLTLEQICSAYQMASPVIVKNEISSSSNVTKKAVSDDINLTTSPNPELTISKSNRGGFVIQYKDHEYSNPRNRSGGKIYWSCRSHNHPKCKNCPGSITVHWASGQISSVKEHSHTPGIAKLEESSMGTEDTTVRYSLSKKKTPVLHYQGYAYLKHSQQPVNSPAVRWVCRETFKKPTDKTQKRCAGFIHTNQGEVVRTREHNHLPPDVKPKVTEEENRMLSPLFL